MTDPLDRARDRIQRLRSRGELGPQRQTSRRAREAEQLRTRGHVCDRAAVLKGRRICWQCLLKTRLHKATKP